ncbi:MAG: ABC transporter permease [Anaerolineaceae bacterium]|nr:ABC transporter permease [Anaerolineaceae bacterium]
MVNNDKRASSWDRFRGFFVDLMKKESTGIFLVVIVLVVGLSIATPHFLTRINILNVLLQLSVMAFMALGMTFVIVGGGIDLSMAGVLTLSGVLGSSVMVETENAVLGVLVMVALGVALGFINGFAIAKLKMVPFIVTLSTMVLTTGMAAWYTKGVTVGPVLDSIYAIGRRDTFIIPIPVIMVVVASVVLYYFLQRTAFGRSLFATGASELAARSSGIGTTRMIFSTYVISGLCASIAGLTLVARLGVASSGMGGELLILDAISAVVIGGASLSGGRGSILGTLGGVLIISLIGNGLNLFGVSYFLTIIVKGVVIFLAVLLDAWRTRKI